MLRAVLAQHPVELAEARRREMALVLPELGSPVALAGEAQRLLLHRAVEATLAEAARSGLGAVIVDDLQLGDDASVAFLQSLIQAETLAALRWGFAQRSADAGAAATALRAALEDAQLLEAVALAPLDLAQMTELIESLALAELDAARLAPALLRHSGGNPMFALETLKDMVLSGASAAAGHLPQPATVAALVERRLLQLSPPALKLARAAALAGASFSAELAAAVLELHPLDIAEPWRELEAAQVIRDGAFAHDLIFEATRASVPAPIAQLLHRRIAAHLQARDAQPARIAPHWAGAHEWSLAGEAHVLAARQAQSASQRGHEVEHWRRAQECFDKAFDQERSFDARCESVQALIVVEGVAHASTVIDALLAEARSDEQRVAALIARAFAALMAVDHRTGIAAAVQAAELARAFASPWPRLEAQRLHAVGLAQSGHAIEGLSVIEPLREQVERDGNAEQRARFWSDYAYVLNTARHLRDTATALGHAIEHAQSLGDLAELATLTSNLATVKGNLGHVDEALELAQRSLALQVQLGTTDGPSGGVVETYVGLYCGMSRPLPGSARTARLGAGALPARRPDAVDRGRQQPQGAVPGRARPVRARPAGARIRRAAGRIGARARHQRRGADRAGARRLGRGRAAPRPRHPRPGRRSARAHARAARRSGAARAGGGRDPLRRRAAHGRRARVRRRGDEGGTAAREVAASRRSQRRGGGAAARAAAAARQGAAGRHVPGRCLVDRVRGVRRLRRERGCAGSARSRHALDQGDVREPCPGRVPRQLPEPQPGQPRPAGRGRATPRSAAMKAKLPAPRRSPHPGVPGNCTRKAAGA